MPGTAFAWKRIERALERAAHWRQFPPDTPAPGPPGPGGTAGQRAEYYQALAAELIASGMRRRAAQSMTRGAVEQRRRRARLGVDPRTSAGAAGRGRGRWGERWGRKPPP